MADEPVVPTSPTPSPGADLGAPPVTPGSGLAGEPVAPASPEPAVTPPKAGGETPPKEPTPAPAPTPKEAPKPAPTAADPKAGEKAPETPGDWPEDWRARLAGDNKAALKRLERMQSPGDVLKSYLALEQKLSAGEYAKKLPDHYTAEELAEYKKSNGIPDDAKDYDVKVDGIVWGEADKPLLDSWTQYAHENNLTPQEVKRGLAWYAREQEAMVDRMAEQDNINMARGGDALRAELGKEYQPTLNALRTLYDGAPKIADPSGQGQPVDMWDVVMSSRDSTGRRLGDIPEFLKWGASLAKELNPYATIVPPGGGDPAKSIESRMGELNRMMADKSGPYWRGDQSAALQQEWRDLYDAQERAKGRAA